MVRETQRLGFSETDLPLWAEVEASSEALHRRSFARLVEGGLLRAAVATAGGGAWLPDIDSLVGITARGHVLRAGEERIVGLRLSLRPRPDATRNDNVDEIASWRVVGAGQLIADEVQNQLTRRGGRPDRAAVRDAVERALDVVWESATPVDLRNPVARLAQLRRVALPECGLTDGIAAGVLTLESSGWPGATGVLPSGQLNVGVDVADDGELIGTGLPWAAALHPFSDHDLPLALADGARAAANAIVPLRPEPPRVSGALVGSPWLGADVLVALVPLKFGAPALVVSSELIAGARLSSSDKSGRVLPLTVGDALIDRHGSGGVIAEVRSPAELPRLADGTPVDVLLDPVHVVRWRRFGTFAEVGANARDIRDSASGLPIDASAGVLHVLRQARPNDRPAAGAAVVRATLTSVGWEREGASDAVVATAVPDPSFARETCGVPRSLWPGHDPATVLVVGSRPGAIQAFRALPINGDVIRLPTSARSLFVAPWRGDPAIVVPAPESLAATVASRAQPLVDSTVAARVTLAALRPPTVRSVLAGVPARLARFDEQFDRGIVTDEERAQSVRAELDLISGDVCRALDEEMTREPSGVLGTLTGSVRAWMLAPFTVDPVGRAGGPWFCDCLEGVSPRVMCAAVAPSGAAVDWPARALHLTERLIELCNGMQVTERDCGRPALPDDRVRSPLECHALLGVCAACVGVLPGRDIASPLGAPVGLLGAVALGRALPDLWLHTFHVCGGHLPAQHGLLRFEELVDGTRPPTAAVLARRDGVVRFVDGALTLVDGAGTEVQTIAAHDLRFDLKHGAPVTAGTPLTIGAVPLDELARLAGDAAVDRYVADDMVSLLEGEGIDVSRNLIECVVRAIRVTWPWRVGR